MYPFMDSSGGVRGAPFNVTNTNIFIGITLSPQTAIGVSQFTSCLTAFLKQATLLFHRTGRNCLLSTRQKNYASENVR